MTGAALVLVLVGAGLSGCLEQDVTESRTGDPSGETSTDWRLGGVFTRNASQEDLQDIQGEADARGGDLRVMESFPMQYMIDGLTQSACIELRALLQEKDYVDTVRECRLVQLGEDPDEPADNTTAAAER